MKNLHDQTSVAIGTPGDRVGIIEKAGSVTLVPINASPTLPALRLSQYSPGIPDNAETDDAFGTALSYLPVSTEGLVVGAPHETIGSNTWTGSVTYTRNLTTWSPLSLAYLSPGTSISFASFGGVLAQPTTAR
ncbi:MAG: hypothetical protein IPL43_14795 [Micropruina sp.]|nr:hypothetical protein [Micropruina sp.]